MVTIYFIITKYLMMVENKLINNYDYIDTDHDYFNRTIYSVSKHLIEPLSKIVYDYYDDIIHISVNAVTLLGQW